MDSYTISRVNTGPNGTFGIWTDDSDGSEVCRTVERPWLDNLADVSCLPTGTYTCTAYSSPKHGKVWMINGTAPRTDCEIHAANLASELEGCVGVGDRFGMIEGIPAVMDSQLTLMNLRATLPDVFQLNIVDNLPD